MIGFKSLLANYLAVTLGKLLKPSKLWFPHLLNWDANTHKGFENVLVPTEYLFPQYLLGESLLLPRIFLVWLGGPLPHSRNAEHDPGETL